MWEVRLRELLAFREAQGHIDVPRRWPENPALAHWVINQRRLIRLGKLSSDRVARLEELGIRWRSGEERLRERDRSWNRMCDALQAYLRERGHCDVPEGWPANPELARWTARQRHLLRAGALRPDRLRRFEERGIDWSLERGRSRSRDRAWDRMFAALKEFRRVHGTCEVPKAWPANPKLVRWLIRQRAQLRRGALRQDRRERFEEIGLSRGEPPARSGTRRRVRRVRDGARERRWRAGYDALSQFHALNGHSDVPRRFPQDPRLARWVSLQRERFHAGRLSPQQLALLQQLRFSWWRRAAVSAPAAR